jgi:hypothetical protein
MPDPDPENEIDDIEGPAHRNVIAPDPDAGGYRVPDQRKAQKHGRRSNRESYKPGQRRLGGNRRQNLIVQPPEAYSSFDNGRRL